MQAVALGEEEHGPTPHHHVSAVACFLPVQVISRAGVFAACHPTPFLMNSCFHVTSTPKNGWQGNVAVPPKSAKNSENLRSHKEYLTWYRAHIRLKTMIVFAGVSGEIPSSSISGDPIASPWQIHTTGCVFHEVLPLPAYLYIVLCRYTVLIMGARLRVACSCIPATPYRYMYIPPLPDGGVLPSHLVPSRAASSRPSLKDATSEREPHPTNPPLVTWTATHPRSDTSRPEARRSRRRAWRAARGGGRFHFPSIDQLVIFPMQRFLLNMDGIAFLHH
jgi:hypothetical protein